ncbi:MAG: hypothetical protein FJ098_00200 [Deltaproteobacteria bacterium]|nr:hypothetical protein [Deltaproteobacteria bacterium]
MRTPPPLIRVAVVAAFLHGCLAPLPPGVDAPELVTDAAGPEVLPDLAPELPTDVPADVAGTDADAPSPRSFGEPCDRDADCASGYCIEHGGGLCTRPCGEEPCPEGWECTEWDEGGEDLCVPATCEPLTCGDLAAECGEPADGCGGALACGSCGPDAACTPDFACACLYASCGTACCGEGEVCEEGLCAVAVCDVTDASCDGVDDDCDGTPDDDYVVDASCGTGACQAGNMPSKCIGGILVPCTPGSPAADDDTCDGVDDDCDGIADEDFLPDGSCGKGWCKASNVPSSCALGVETPCLPGLPLGQDTTCDGVDDDCDGFPDDNVVPSFACGMGACALGTTPSSCVGGVPIPCLPGPPLATDDATCNGVDEDCDGLTDEDYLSQGSCGTGVCEALASPSLCAGGFEQPCLPGQPLGPDVTCDGLDDDCDGTPDEDYVPVMPCGTGVCRVLAIPSSCALGAETPCTPGQPIAAEDVTCDGVDDDCDGGKDEDAIPPCVFGAPVTGLPVSFLSSRGLIGPVSEVVDGVYTGRVVDLDTPASAVTVTGHAGPAASAAVTFPVVAGPPTELRLVTSRGEVWQDAPGIYAVARITDAAGCGAQVSGGPLFSLQGFGTLPAMAGTSLGDGLWGAWLEVPAAAFPAGVAAKGGWVKVQAGVLSAQAGLAAEPVPTPQALSPGRVALLLPMGPRRAGEALEVPVVVNTGTAHLGLYSLVVFFDEELLTLTGVGAGAAEHLTTPESGSLAVANASGQIAFNGISTNPLAGGTQGTALEVAVLHFTAHDDLAGEAAAQLSGVVTELASTLLTDLRTGDELLVQDGNGLAPVGDILLRPVARRGIFLVPGDAVLINDSALTGLPVTAPLEILGLGEDHVLVPLDPGEATCFSLAPGVAGAAGCVALAAGPGKATLVAQAGAADASAVVRVVAPSLPLTVSVDDTTLEYIGELDRLQETRARARATFGDGAGLSWVLDVTDRVSWSASGAVAVTAGGLVLAAGEGAGQVIARDALGASLGSAAVSVTGGNTVSIEGLHVMVPAHLTLTQPPAAPVLAASADLVLEVTDLLTADGQEAPVLVHAVLTDDLATGGGSRVDVTGWEDLTLATTDPGVGTVSGGWITATGSGEASIQAELSTGSGPVTGEASLRVQLPPPAGLEVTVASPKLALSATDVAATVRGLPTKRQLAVKVHFQDGTSRDYTADPATHYSVTSPILQVFNPGDCPLCPPGQVAASGQGAGAGSVQVSFNDPHLASLAASVALEVVSHGSLAVTVLEPHTPTGALPVPEGLLSRVEGTGSWQRARLQATELFTDGVSLDVTQHPALSWQVVAPGTQTPLPGVVTLQAGGIQGLAPGAVELRGSLGGHAAPPVPLSVEAGSVDLVALALDAPGGAVLSGVKGIGTAPLQVKGTFADGTRALLTGGTLVPGLLAFQGNAPFVQVSAQGLMTIQGNGPVTLTAALAAGANTGAPAPSPAARLILANLLPAPGDVDLGEAVGLAHPDRDADEVFEVPVRVHTAGQDLGGIDLEITYDPLVLEILDLLPGAGLAAAVFSANGTTPGMIYLNASPSLGQPCQGEDLEVAVLVFRALKGGPQVTPVGGTVVTLVDALGSAIGPPTPRPLVAGAGDLDPAPGGVWGDANDDDAFTVADVLYIRRLKAGTVQPGPAQLLQSDVFPDGEVLVSDAYLASQILARLAHFVELTATPVAGGFHLQARLADRAQEPVDAGVAVRFEVAAPGSVATLAFTLPHVPSAGGVVTPAIPEGGGSHGTTMTGLAPGSSAGVVVVLDVLGPGGMPVWSTPFLSTPLVDPGAPFSPLLVVGTCVPSCAGAVCGHPDGCGGTCDGPCPGPEEVCQEGACVPGGCVPLTCPETGIDCGITLDGCGWILDCGGCPAGQSCLGGACIPDGCSPACGGKLCGDADGCGGICFGPCPWDAQVCAGGVCECMGAECGGKACGDPDGCGGLCQGPCPGEHDECSGGLCVCGGTPCGAACCGQDELCQGGSCVPSCVPDTCGDPGAECGEAPDGCGGTLACGLCGANAWCTPAHTCECLVEECLGVCCDPMEQCLAGACAVCVPDCGGKTCGDPDGCGGICLSCPGQNEVCANGVCLCEGSCEGKLCGADDGCGATCQGPCPQPYAICNQGACACKYSACGTVCCNLGQVCTGGVCVAGGG